MWFQRLSGSELTRQEGGEFQGAGHPGPEETEQSRGVFPAPAAGLVTSMRGPRGAIVGSQTKLSSALTGPSIITPAPLLCRGPHRT